MILGMGVPPKLKPNLQRMGNIIAVVAGLLMLVAGDPLDRMLVDVLAVIVDQPAPKPAAVPPSLESPANVGEPPSVQAGLPKEVPAARDWVDVTDKLVDWFTKIVGSLTALLGVIGIAKPFKNNCVENIK